VPLWWAGKKVVRESVTEAPKPVRKKGEKKQIPANSRVIVHIDESIKEDIIKADHIKRRRQYRRDLNVYHTSLEQRQSLITGGIEDLIMPKFKV
jgi:hypothetical protein